MSFNPLRSLFPIGLNPSPQSISTFLQPKIHKPLIKSKSYCRRATCHGLILKYLQPPFYRTPHRCLSLYNLTRRHAQGDDKFFCYHRGFRDLPSNSFAFNHTPLDEGIHTSSGVFRRFPVNPKLTRSNKIFSSNQIQCFHTSSVCNESNFKPTPPGGTPEDKDPSLEYERSGKTFLDGPDQVIPSDAVYTWHARGAVRIGKLGKAGSNKRPPISIPSLFKSTVERDPNFPALAEKQNGIWEKTSYEEYYEDVWRTAKGFIALGLERHHGVCILGFNSPEWFKADLGAIFAGGMPTGIYTTNSPSACAYIAEDSKANIYVVEDEQQLSKILQYRNKLPHLKAIIQYRGKPSCEGVLSWDELMKIGEQQSDAALKERLKQMAVNQCCTLIYTSGTTGNPKGVMLSHDNITWMSREVVDFAGFVDGQEEVISFLPLSHIAAQTTDMYFPMVSIGTVYFADGNALKGTLINTMKEVQPTKFLAVPRVWEKMYEALKAIGSKNTGLKLTIANWAKEQATARNKKRLAGDPSPPTLEFKLADKIVFSNIKEALGLSRSTLNISAAAPLSMEVMEYFMSLDIIITEAYGLSESSGPHILGLEQRKLVRFGSIGVELPNVGTRLNDVTPDGQGEICLGGRHITIGYLGKEDKTKEAIDDVGWLHTEDLGKIEEDGFIFITGRIKELLITAGGENVAPVPIEDNIKQALPCLSNAMVVGDRLKFLSVLITFKTGLNQETNECSDTLVEESKSWIEQHGDCKVDTVKEVFREVYEKKNSKLINAINTGVMLANSKSVSKAQKVQKWVILPKDFSIPGGELTPTLKLKRSTVVDKYKNVIDEIYNDGLDPNSTGALG